MCLTIPLKIISVKDGKACVTNQSNQTYHVDVALLKNLKPGDWILANADIALRRITEQEAQELLNFFT